MLILLMMISPESGHPVGRRTAVCRALTGQIMPLISRFPADNPTQKVIRQECRMTVCCDSTGIIMQLISRFPADDPQQKTIRQGCRMTICRTLTGIIRQQSEALPYHHSISLGPAKQARKRVKGLSPLRGAGAAPLPYAPASHPPLTAPGRSAPSPALRPA